MKKKVNFYFFGSSINWQLFTFLGLMLAVHLSGSPKMQWVSISIIWKMAFNLIFQFSLDFAAWVNIWRWFSVVRSLCDKIFDFFSCVVVNFDFYRGWREMSFGMKFFWGFLSQIFFKMSQKYFWKSFQKKFPELLLMKIFLKRFLRNFKIEIIPKKIFISKNIWIFIQEKFYGGILKIFLRTFLNNFKSIWALKLINIFSLVKQIFKILSLNKPKPTQRNNSASLFKQSTFQEPHHTSFESEYHNSSATSLLIISNIAVLHLIKPSSVFINSSHMIVKVNEATLRKLSLRNAMNTLPTRSIEKNYVEKKLSLNNIFIKESFYLVKGFLMKWRHKWEKIIEFKISWFCNLSKKIYNAFNIKEGKN